jgi:hypothetical protein
VTGLVDSSIAQYAVIEARRTEGPSERFVIAYRDEESLRELIAGPSIMACGFASREEAQANIDADFWTAALGRKLQKTGLRISTRSCFRQAALRSRVQPDADRENRSWLSPGGCGRGHSHLLFQKCRVHRNSVICWRLILVGRCLRVYVHWKAFLCSSVL